MSITTLIKTIQDIMRKDVGVDGDAQRISQMVWLLFLKIFDDREQEWKTLNPKYKSPLAARFQWSNWAANPEGETGEDLISFVNNNLFPELKGLATKAGVTAQGKLVGSVFEDAYNYMKSGTLLRQVINTIQQDVDFNSSEDRHLFNDIYEKILADLQSAGNAGEYYTPRAVTQFMVDIINPQLGETILDPACGTGGFLTCTIENLRKQIKTPEENKILQETIHGVEKKPLPHMLAVTNMMLHGIEVPTNIRHDNTLSRPLKDYGPKDRVDIVVTNPPFGGMEEDGIEKNFPKKYQTRETADLFLALIMHLLKHNTGRAAIVLPDGFLFGEGVKTNLKRELLTEFNLHTIVRLPKGVFSPYTGINTNLLFLEKGGPTKQVWFFEHPYPEGYKSYSRSKPLTIQEFELEKKWWNKRKENEYAWKVSVKEIEAKNYNLDFKNPHVVDIDHGDPEEFIKEFEEISKKLIETRNALKEELIKALERKYIYKETVQLLKKYFDIIVEVPDGIKNLRELILTLAIQGKLVPQNPDDQPASGLLKEIEAEKKRLTDEGKIKAGKPLPEIKPEELPYEVPDGWEWVKLQDICNLKTGATPTTTKKSYFGGNIKWLVSGDIHKREIYDCDGRITELGMNNSNCKILPIDSVLIALNGQGKTRATVAILKTEATCNQSLVAIIPYAHRDIVSKYIFWNLHGRYYSIRDITGQDKRRGLNMKLVGDLLLSLPPLDEQKRIIAKIDQLMKLCNELAQQIKAGTEKKESILSAVLARA